MLQLKPSFINVIELLVTRFKDTQYCLRGTTSLVLQNIDMNVDDIDILCDEATALVANDLLKEFVVDPISYKQSDKFKSYFGKFNIHSISVEFMGNWQIKTKKGDWSKVYDGNRFNLVNLNGMGVKVTTIEDELEMFLLMGRFSAYQKIKKQLQSKDIINFAKPGLFN